MTTHFSASLLKAPPEAQAGLMAATIVNLAGLVKEAKPAAKKPEVQEPYNEPHMYG